MFIEIYCFLNVLILLITDRFETVAWGNVWKCAKPGTAQKSWSETADAKITKVSVKITKPKCTLINAEDSLQNSFNLKIYYNYSPNQ